MDPHCIGCRSPLQPSYKACPSCGEAITPFLREHLQKPVAGNYELTSFLARGGMGEVYKARHIHLQSDCVIKVMRPDTGADRNSLHDRFVREARLARKIRHPNVALLYEFSVLADGTYYMVWEFIDGPNLSRVIANEGALQPRRAVQLAIEVLAGLEAIHRAGIVHRDISPDNVVIATEDGCEVPKIIDLGIAKADADAGQTHTAAGVFVGKLRYASPEQLGALPEGERIDGRSDVYSFGLVLYEMLAGRPAFHATNPNQYFALQLGSQPRELELPEQTAEARDALRAVLARAIEKKRDVRYPTARAFADALRGVLPLLIEEVAVKTTTVEVPAPAPAPITAPPTPATSVPPTSPSARRAHSPMRIAGATGVVVVVATILLTMWLRQSESGRGELAETATAPVQSAVVDTSALQPLSASREETTTAFAREETAPPAADAAPEPEPEQPPVIARDSPQQQAEAARAPVRSQQAAAVDLFTGGGSSLRLAAYGGIAVVPFSLSVAQPEGISGYDALTTASEALRDGLRDALVPRVQSIIVDYPLPRASVLKVEVGTLAVTRGTKTATVSMSVRVVDNRNDRELLTFREQRSVSGEHDPELTAIREIGMLIGLSLNSH